MLKRLLDEIRQRKSRPKSPFPQLQADIGHKYILLERLGWLEGQELYLAAGPEQQHYWLSTLEKDTGYLQRAQRDFRTYSELSSHPNLSVFTDADFQSKVPWAVRPVNVGVNAADLLKKSPHPPEFVEKFLEDGLKALGALSSKGLVYPDWDPTNIFYCDDHWVLGLGFYQPPHARVEVGSSALNRKIYYVSPEVISGNVSTESDLYSLGAMAFHLLIGSPVFPKDEPMEILYATMMEDPPNLAELHPELPRQLTDKIQTMIRKKPYERGGHLPGRTAEPQPPSQQVAKFLQDASQGGVAEGIGRFTLDPRKALQKLLDYQFQEPIHLLYAALTAAEGLQAKSVSIKSSKREVKIVFEDATTELSSMESALLAACQGRQENPMTHLGLAIVGALGAGFDKVELIGMGHKVTFTDLAMPTATVARGKGLTVRCLGRGLEQRATAEFKSAVSVSRIPISWNGELLSELPGPSERVAVTIGDEMFELRINLDVEHHFAGLYLRTHALAFKRRTRLLAPRSRVIIDGPWNRDVSYQFMKRDPRVEELARIAERTLATRLAQRLLQGPIDWSDHTFFFIDMLRAIDDDELLDRLHAHIVEFAPDSTSGFDNPTMERGGDLDQLVRSSCEYVRTKKLASFERASVLLTRPRYLVHDATFGWDDALALARAAFPRDPASLWKFLFWVWLFHPLVDAPVESIPDLLWCCSQISPGQRGLWDGRLAHAVSGLQAPDWLRQCGQSIPSEGFVRTRYAIGIDSA